MSDTKTLLSLVVNEAKNEMHVHVKGDPAKIIALMSQACGENPELAMMLLMALAEMTKTYRPESDRIYVIPLAALAAKLITEAEDQNEAIKNLVK